MLPWNEPNKAAWVFHPANDRDWSALVAECNSGQQFEAIAEVARRGRCRTVVIENRYVDPDYRSEFSAFWSRRFEGTSAFSRRVHFFRSRIEENELHRIDRKAKSYLGYCVLRPIPHPEGRVGRTVIAPPPQLKDAIRVTVTDEVTLFGARLSVTGAPYCAQDGEYLRCAHAALWVCHYTAFKRGLVGRKLTAELAEMVPSVLSPSRSLPSPGLGFEQIQAVFDGTGQPALLYGLADLPDVPGVKAPAPPVDSAGRPTRESGGTWNTRLFSVLCRYLNSGFPVMVASQNHAIVLIGWEQKDGRIRFVVTDDQQGPYEIVDSPFDDRRGDTPWNAVMIPMPPKVFLSGEMAETWGHKSFHSIGTLSTSRKPWKQMTKALSVTPKGMSLRTFLMNSNDYKERLIAQRRDPDAIRELRLARLPHFVWVVEAQSRELRARGKACVIGEVIFDPMSSDHPHRAPRMGAISVPGLTLVSPPDGGNDISIPVTDSPWRSFLDLPATG